MPADRAHCGSVASHSFMGLISSLEWISLDCSCVSLQESFLCISLGLILSLECIWQGSHWPAQCISRVRVLELSGGKVNCSVSVPMILVCRLVWQYYCQYSSANCVVGCSQVSQPLLLVSSRLENLRGGVWLCYTIFTICADWDHDVNRFSVQVCHGLVWLCIVPNPSPIVCEVSVRAH